MALIRPGRLWWTKVRDRPKCSEVAVSHRRVARDLSPPAAVEQRRRRGRTLFSKAEAGVGAAVARRFGGQSMCRILMRTSPRKPQRQTGDGADEEGGGTGR